tara:strand:- start:411 stop:4259 length:3849 start_codon:yes stop_codon:yes gene_type:complete
MNNSSQHMGGGIACYLSSPSLINSILWNDSPPEIFLFGEEITIAYSDIQGGENGIITQNNVTVNWGEGNIDAHPLFCNPDSGDFTLAENSPCVGTGENGANMGALGVGCGIIDVSLSITEIMQNPSAVNDSEGEWFEIFNSGDIELDLNGWTIKDADTDNHTISSSLIINPGEYKILGINSNSSTNGGVTVNYQYSGIILANGADELVLINTNDTVFDSVAYDGGATFPDPEGASMALVHPDSNNNVGTNWQASTTAYGDGDLGTPGMPNYMSNIELDTYFVNFETVNMNETATNTVVISNTGNADLVVDSISIGSGSSLSFDGVDDYAEITNQSSATSVFGYAFTSTAWVKVTGGSGTNRNILTNAQMSGDGYVLQVTNENQFSGIIDLQSGWSTVWGNTDVGLNTWYHFAFSYDGSSLRLYVNGELDGENSNVSGEIIDPVGNSSFFIGAQGTGALFFPGIIGEITIWNITLTQEEIQSYMSTSLSSSETGLVGYWKFNEGTGTTLTDQTSNGNDGTINGAIWSTDSPSIIINESNEFTITLDNYTIAPTSTTNLNISFLPTVYGNQSTSALIYTNDPDRPIVSLEMSGFGYYPSPDIELESSSIDFGDVMHGLTGHESFTIYNNGETELDIDTIYCTANFSVNPGNADVGSGDSFDLDIIFTPDSDSSFTGTMTIVSNDPDEDTLTVSLSGNGTPHAPIMEVSADLLDFGTFEQEQTITRQLTIYNMGMLDLSIEEINISGNNGFSTTFSDATIAPGDSVVADFQFYTEDNITEAFATATVVTTDLGNVDIELRAGYFGPVWHVATTGSNETGDGSEENPFATIQAGIDVTDHGDTVRVSSGTYIEFIDFNGKNISVIGEDRENTIIDGGWHGISVVRIEDVEGICALKGITISNGYSDYGGGIYCSNASLDLENLIIEANSAGLLGGGIYLENSNANISQTIINDNGSSGEGGGIYTESSNVYFNDVIISNNRVIDGGGGAISFHSDSYDSISFTNTTIANNTSGMAGNIQISGRSSVSLQSVTIHDNILEGGADGSAGIYSAGEGHLNLHNVSIINNYAYDCGDNDECVGSLLFDASDDFPSSISIINSIFWNHSGNEFHISTGNAEQVIDISYSNIRNGYDGEQIIEADPLFCDQGNSDFMLGENSPCVGSGLDGVNMGALDVGCNEGQEWETEYVAINSENIPLQYSLYQNYPNPFNPITTVRYDLPVDANVNITIYDLMGRSIRSLVNSQQTAGYKSVRWNATNNLGQPVSAGVYLYSIEAGEFRQTKKMVLLK